MVTREDIMKVMKEHAEDATFSQEDISQENKMVWEVNGDDPELQRAQVFSTKVKEERTLLDRLSMSSDWRRAVIAIARLKQGKQVKSFMDQYKVLRIGGRLSKSVLHSHIKHPAIVPKASHVASPLIKHYHERVHHQEKGMTVNELCSDGIWITGCCSAVAS